MLFDAATDTQVQAARLLTGATMVGLLAARIFGRRAQSVRIIVAGLYIAGIVAYVMYVLI